MGVEEEINMIKYAKEKEETQKILMSEKALAEKDMKIETKEKELADREINLNIEKKRIEEQGENLLKKKDLIVDNMMRSISGDWSTASECGEEVVRNSVDRMVTSILESGDDSLMTSMFNDHESGTDLTEESQMEQDDDDAFWAKQKEQINNHDKPLEDYRLLDDDQEQVPESRQTPEGQVRIERLNRHEIKNPLMTGIRGDRSDPRHASRAGQGRGLHHGGDRRRGRERKAIRKQPRNKRKKKPVQLRSKEKTDYFVLLNPVQFCNFSCVENFEKYCICNKDVKNLWLPFVQRHLTRTEIRKDIRRRLSNGTNRVRNLAWTETKTGQKRLTQKRLLGHGSKEQTNSGVIYLNINRKSRRGKDQRTSDVVPGQHQPLSTPQSVLRRRTLFSSPAWKGAACVCRESRRPFNVSPHHFHYCDKCNPTLVNVV